VDRNFPATAFGEVVKTLDRSGVVDYMQMWDQHTSWFPPSLWTPDVTPMANVVADADSFPDWWVMAGYGAAQAPGLGIVISSDALRRGPAELTQTMLTLANITEGRAIFQLGGGELKQAKPFGHKRAHGLDRLEDFFQIFHKFWDSDGPIDFTGKRWNLEQAWLGKARGHKPQLWGLGGGPRIIDMTTTYADGFATMAPMIWSSPEEAAEAIAKFKKELEARGRDPEAFQFGIWAAMLLHEDEQILDRALDNPLMRFQTAILGRIIQSDWRKEGIEPPMPPDWHYALKMLPTGISRAEADEWIGRTTREMSEKSWFYGTPASVAAELEAYVDAGVTWINVLDALPMILEPDDAQTAITRSLDVCARLKAR
jgi:phthiodiolone/phenolphthiodiolone dimycocerosates ketoreductase